MRIITTFSYDRSHGYLETNGMGPLRFKTDIENKVIPIDFITYRHTKRDDLDCSIQIFGDKLEDCYCDDYKKFKLPEEIPTIEWLHEHVTGIESIALSIVSVDADNFEKIVAGSHLQLESLAFHDEIDNSGYVIDQSMIDDFNKRLSEDHGKETLYYEE